MRWKGVWKWGKREMICLWLHCHHQNNSWITMGSDESHFKVSLIVRDKPQDRVHRPQPFRTERRTEAVSNRGPSAYQPNALPLGQTGSPWSVTSIKAGICVKIIKHVSSQLFSAMSDSIFCSPDCVNDVMNKTGMCVEEKFQLRKEPTLFCSPLKITPISCSPDCISDITNKPTLWGKEAIT